MDLNLYRVYSMVSTTENLNESDNGTISKIIEKINSLNNEEEVKQFLLEELNIKTPIQNFPLKGKGILNFEDYETTISIEIVHENEHSIFCYEK